MADTENDSSAITCTYCDLNFTKKSNLYRHVRNLHNTKPDLTKSNKKCPLCEELFVNRHFLNNHFRVAHDIEIKEETLGFDSWEEFQVWKETEEKRTCSQYVKRRVNATTAKGDHQTLYMCNRDGNYTTTSTGERRVKSQGSCKINGNCPASMVLTLSSEQPNKWTVHYICTHVGHAKELGHIRLPASGRMLVAEKLKCKIPPKVILDDTKSTEPAGSRLRCLTSKDIRNIKQSAGIQEEYKLHNNDHTSVNMWVQRLKDRKQVLYFKPQGETDPEHKELDSSDFVLILQTEEQTELTKMFCNEDVQTGSATVCIDSTHGLGYDMQLTTLMSIDEAGAGFPLAEMISSRVNSDTLTIFFSQIRAKTGQIKCKYFMSDDFQGFFNSWVNVMGENNTQKLLCSWHVDKSWKAHFNMKDDDQKMLYKDLKTLQMEPDATIFEAAMEGLVEKVKESQTLKHLEKYIERYRNRSHEWAYCYRVDAHLSTNMFLEAFHKKLKYIYFDGKVIKRIDKSLYFLLKLIRDASVEREIRLMKNTPTYRVKKINRAHDQGKMISNTDVDQVEPGANEWTVKSQSCDGYYIVKQVHNVCSLYGDTCRIRCNACYVCVHMMSCNCVEAMVGAGLCKHIHAVVMKYFMQMNLLSKTQLMNHSEMTQDNIEDINATFLVPTQNEIRAKQLINKLQSIQVLAQEKFPKCSSEALDSIESQMQLLESKILSSAASEQIPNFGVKIPENKNITPQQRFVSVRKKNNKMLSLRKPNIQERGTIVDELLKRRKISELPNVYEMMMDTDDGDGD